MARAGPLRLVVRPSINVPLWMRLSLFYAEAQRIAIIPLRRYFQLFYHDSSSLALSHYNGLHRLPPSYTKLSASPRQMLVDTLPGASLTLYSFGSTIEGTVSHVSASYSQLCRIQAHDTG
jgi:hypothetical protein